DVGKTLNSTGRVMYMETSSTITEIVMLVLISMSSRKAGSGMIIASTIPKTASGTATSERAGRRDAVEPETAGWFLLTGPRAAGGGVGLPRGFPETGAICDVAAIRSPTAHVPGQISC